MENHHHLPFGIDFTSQTETELAAQLSSIPVPTGGGPLLVCTANLAHIVELRVNAEFRAAYRNAWCVTADGTPVYLYARARGARLPERLAGSGLIDKLLRQLSPGRHRLFFIAPTQDVASRCSSYLVETAGFDPAAIDYVVPKPGFENDLTYSEALAARIREHRTTHLILGVGAPKSEIWANTHRDQLGDCYVMCVGAGLEFFVGIRSRGPEWMRSVGLEWLCRVAQEPRRLFKRYFISSWRFLLCVAVDLSGKDVLIQRASRRDDPGPLAAE